MKWIIRAWAVLLLSSWAASFPHDGYHPIEARDVSSGPQPQEVEVIVYVDQNGKTLSVEKHYHPTTATATATATAHNSPTDLPPLVISPDVDAPHELVPTLATDTASHSQHVQDERQFGISYSPYNADSTCKSQDQVNGDLDRLNRYAFIRIYGVDCDQTQKVVSAARQRNMKVFAGVYDLQNLQASLKFIVDAARGDWTIFHTVSIGNELINRNKNSVADVTNAVQSARSYLRNAGYRGPVVTIDTFSKMLEHPELCQASDYCAANCHAFFDAAQTPESAGQYVSSQARQISAAAGGKRTIISESGWPHAGQPNGAAVPSPENHRTAIDSLRRTFADNNGDLILFSAFDDAWKADNPWTFGAERFWGIEN